MNREIEVINEKKVNEMENNCAIKAFLSFNIIYGRC